MTGSRVRRDPRDRASMRRRVPQAASETNAPVREIASGTALVAVVIDGGVGTLSPSDGEALRLGRDLAAGAAQGVLALIVSGEVPTGLAAAGVDRVAISLSPDPGTLARCLASEWLGLGLDRAVAVDGGAAAETLRRLAALTEFPIRTNVASIDGGSCICLEEDRTRERRRDDATIVIAAPGRFRPYPAPTLSPRGAALPVDLPEPVGRSDSDADELVDLGVERASPAMLPLTEAGLVLSAGAGVLDWTLFGQLAEELDAAVGGSRVVCDAGHVPRDRQVGISGTVIAPRCYVALGISGASQHLQGIEDARQVVAVNTNPQAPMMARADLAVVVDTGAVMRALLARLRTRT